MSVTGSPGEAHTGSETARKISERYGVPPEEVDAIITDRPVKPGEPHPMTIGALMKEPDHLAGSDMAQPSSRWTPAAVVGMVLGILGILAIATLLIFLLRWNKEPKHVVVEAPDTTEELVAAPPRLDTIPLEPVIEEAPEPPPTPAPRPTTVRRRARPAPVLSTSNSLEAEERLAELKAGGNTNARIVRRTKRGTTIYEVRR